MNEPITPEWIDKRKAFLLLKEAQRSKREEKEWKYLESGYGRGDYFKNKGMK